MKNIHGVFNRKHHFILQLQGDRIGRRRTLLLAVVVMGPSALAGAAFPNYYFYAGLRLLTCAMFPVVWVSGNAVMLEGFGTRQRVFVVCAKDLWRVEKTHFDVKLQCVCDTFFLQLGNERHWNVQL